MRGEVVVYITHRRMTSSGYGHQHIASVKWRDPSDGGTGSSTRAAMVDWINKGNVARVKDGAGHDVAVGVVDANPPYIRTHADGVWTDNLLSLPNY
jgi:hypothetical protein